MMFPVVLLLEKKLLPDGGKSSYYSGVRVDFKLKMKNCQLEIDSEEQKIIIS